MCEEMKNAAVPVPHAMIWSIIINGILGFGILLGALFCLGDLNTILETPTDYPFMAIFLSKPVWCPYDGVNIRDSDNIGNNLFSCYGFSYALVFCSRSWRPWLAEHQQGIYHVYSIMKYGSLTIIRLTIELVFQ